MADRQTHASEQARWASLNRPTPTWFRRAKLGFFIHWGAYSVPAWAEPTGEFGTITARDWYAHNPYAEWYANTIRLPGSPAAAHHTATYGDQPYASFLDSWTAEGFDPDELVGPLAAAGGRYLVLTTKHHDGIALWEAPGSAPMNTVVRGPHRDLVDLVATAARRAGMRFGAYYSGGLDWWKRPTPPIGLEDTFEINDRPRDQEYAAYAASHVRDLITRYAPDLLWNDVEWPDAGKTFGPDGLGALFEEYYRLVPEGLVNDRWNVPHADFTTSEYQHGLDNEHGVWENCRGLGLSFGYNSAEEPRHALTGPQAVRHLVDVVSRGGRLNLGVGPTAEGRLPDWQLHIVQDLARWTSVAGDLLDDAEPAPEHSATDSEHWLRWARTPDGLLAFVDHPDAGGHEVPLEGAARLLTPEWADTRQAGDQTLVALHPGRPGPAVLRVG